MTESAIVMGGRGQVGSAIFNILRNHGFRAYVLDIGATPKNPPKKAVLHVCIPYSKDFLKNVRAAMKTYSPRLVIVHSTVPVGTTRKLGDKAAHSPVRGQHDRLEWSLLRFIKYVAGVKHLATSDAYDHLKAAGFPVAPWSRPESTELMKLLCLSRYLNDLAYYEKAEKICRMFKVSPALIYDWTDSYNDGYAGTDYVRPALKFPLGKAGGHCVMPVSKMLQSQVKDPWFERNIQVFEPLAKVEVKC